MIVSINQPAYLPWLGYFERIASSDLHIVLDHVQFEKNSMTNRNKVRTLHDWTWLSIPVSSKGKFGNLAINSLATANHSNWQKKHWNTLKGSYAKAPFFKEYSRFLEDLYNKDWELIAPLIEEITKFLLKELEIDTRIINSSSLSPTETKSELILELCKNVGASTYLSGALGKNYLDIQQFERNGIKVKFQDYQHPTYNQIHEGFLPYMSTVDLLFNEGVNSRNIIMKGANHR